MVSGTAGTGKTSLAAHFAAATCARGERVLYFAFEESQQQMLRNMRSIGIDLEPCVKKGLMLFHASRPSLHGLESHLVMMHKLITRFKPQVVIVDPLSNFTSAGSRLEVNGMLLRLIDFLKAEQITALFTSLTTGGNALERTETEMSSLIDTWLLLRDIELGGERNRGLYVLKSRGMAHSNQIREFLLTSHGIDLLEVYTGDDGVLTGSMRVAQEARERAVGLARQQEMDRKQRELERKRRAIEAQIIAMRAEFEAVEDEARLIATQDTEREGVLEESRVAMESRRGGNGAARGRKAAEHKKSGTRNR
jgi:circadian clock protein KaiC